MTSYFFAPPQHASQYTLPEKMTEIQWLLYDNNVPALKLCENPNSAISREL